MQLGDTICACATAAGPAPRCLLRFSGPGCAHVAARLLRVRTPSRVAAFASISLGPGSFPVLAWLATGPGTFTGEDVLEIQFPGGPALRRRLVDLALRLKMPGHQRVRPAQPGEFSARAYLNKRLSAEQAEGIGAVIAATSASEFEAGRALLSGATGAAYARIADEIASCLALVEAGIDFTDQEGVSGIAPARFLTVLEAVRARIEGMLGIDRTPTPGCAPGGLSGESASALPRVVLIGAPNSGKSSLFNALLGRRRSVVSPGAGSTRDAIVETMHLGAAAAWGAPDDGVQLIDLAGLLDDDVGLHPGRSEAASQDRALDEIARCDVAVVCDPGASFAWATAAPAGRSLVRVRTMADRSGAAPPADAGGDVLHVCALDGRGLHQLRTAIGRACAGAVPAGQASSRVLPRHRRALMVAMDAVVQALATCPSPGAPTLPAPELSAHWLRLALDAVGEVSGRIDPDEVIGRIFATFCIGK